MKVLHVPFAFRPDPIGGTEVYVESLAKGLTAHDVTSAIAAPGAANGEQSFGELRVHRFAVGPVGRDFRALYDEGDLQAAQNLGQIMDRENPDVVHLHAYNRAVSIRTVKAIKTRGITAIYTYHTPTLTCQRGTLLRWGEDPCDGQMRRFRCGSCTLHGLGLPKPAAVVMSMSAPATGPLMGESTGRFANALRMGDMIALRHTQVRGFLAEVDRVVALSEWSRKVLIGNGVQGSKITLSRHGIEHARTQNHPSLPFHPSSQLRLGFFGRFDPTKGIDTVVRAIIQDPSLNCSLDVYGIAHGPEGEAYRRYIGAMAAHDRRIEIHDPVEARQVVDLLRAYDAVVVPSRWLETGPLVVLEAFAAGAIVLGSKLGGIAELVRHGIDGLLLEPEDYRAWQTAIREIACDRSLLARLRGGVRQPRAMDDVAAEMAELYRSVA